MKKFRLALIGGGFLNSIVAKAVKDGILPQYELVAVLGKDKERVQAFTDTFGGKPCTSIEELLAEKPDYTAEAARVQAVKEYAEAVVASGSGLIVLSIGAFADKELYERVQKKAAENNCKLYIPSGAVGGFDVLRTAALMGPIKASITSLRSPMDIAHTALGYDGILDVTEPTEVFRGTTKEAIALLPTHVNVGIATALASAGPEETDIDIHVIPGFQGDQFIIKIEGEEVATDLRIYSRTCRIAGWSVVATLQNIASPVEFF